MTVPKYSYQFDNERVFERKKEENKSHNCIIKRKYRFIIQKKKKTVQSKQYRKHNGFLREYCYIQNGMKSDYLR